MTKQELLNGVHDNLVDGFIPAALTDILDYLKDKNSLGHTEKFSDLMKEYIDIENKKVKKEITENDFIEEQRRIGEIIKNGIRGLPNSKNEKKTENNKDPETWAAVFWKIFTNLKYLTIFIILLIVVIVILRLAGYSVINLLPNNAKIIHDTIMVKTQVPVIGKKAEIMKIDELKQKAEEALTNKLYPEYEKAQKSGNVDKEEIAYLNILELDKLVHVDLANLNLKASKDITITDELSKLELTINNFLKN